MRRHMNLAGRTFAKRSHVLRVSIVVRGDTDGSGRWPARDGLRIRRDIADYLGLTLETVSRALSRLHYLRILGFVGNNQRQIVLLDRAQLASLDLQH